MWLALLWGAEIKMDEAATSLGSLGGGQASVNKYSWEVGVPGARPRVSALAGLVWGLRICIFSNPRSCTEHSEKRTLKLRPGGGEGAECFRERQRGRPGHCARGPEPGVQ